MSSVWAYIRGLLGPGLHWDRSQDELVAAIEHARAELQFEAAEHLRFILQSRNAVMCERQKDPRD